MKEQQLTFGEPVGMEPVVPTRRHYDDIIVRSDGSEGAMCDSHADCRGEWHCTDEERHDADVEIVTDILNTHDKWVTEYCTENEDFTCGYDCAIEECSFGWAERIREWLEGGYADYLGHLETDKLAALITDTVDYDLDAVNAEINDCDDPCEHADFIKWFCHSLDADQLVDVIRDRLCGVSDCDVEFCHNEYAAYTGNGCCLGGFDVGEHEEQICLGKGDGYPELFELHQLGRLDDILDDVKSDSYVSRSRRRVKNEETGCYEYVGRDTYDPYGSDYPDLMTYHCPGGRWDWVVCEDTMNEYLLEGLEELFDKFVS